MAIIVSAAAVALFAWHNFMANDSIAKALPIDMPLAVAATILALLGSIAYGKTPEQHMAKIAPALYIAGIGVFGGILASTGFITSPLLGLWVLIATFAGLFGWWGIGGALLLANALLVASMLQFPASRLDTLLAVVTLFAPIAVSYMLWHGNSALFRQTHDQSDKLHTSLKNESAKSNTIIQAISDGVIMTKPSGEISLINPAAQQMTGWTAADALHLHVASIVKLEDEKGTPVQEGTHPILTALTKRQAQRSTLVIVTKSDKRLTAAFSVTPLADGGVIAVFRDITKERAEEREQAEFISTASHEMRTPVASIEGFLGLALSPKVATIDEKAREYISKAHTSAQYLGRLLKDLLEISRAEDGRLHNNMVVVEAVELARQTTESLQPKAAEKGLKLIYQPSGNKSTTGDTTIAPVLYTRADKDRLHETLSNLIENAIKYTPSGQVVVDVTTHHNQVRFSVKDSGIGIPPEDLPHLFQKFYRVDNSDTREISGTGLGLYLSRKLIESMHGKISAESEYHKGSTFYIDLPRINREQAIATLESDERRAAQQAAQAEEIAAQGDGGAMGAPAAEIARTPASEVATPLKSSGTDAAPLAVTDSVADIIPQAIPALESPVTPPSPPAAPPMPAPAPVAAPPTMQHPAPQPISSTTPMQAQPAIIHQPPHTASSPMSQPVNSLPASMPAQPSAQPPTSSAAAPHQPPIHPAPRPNTPLSSIERNTEQYLTRRQPPQSR